MLGSSGKKVVFHHLVFVAPLPNAMIKNNNIDNSVPSTEQWTEIPTSVLLKNGIHGLLCCLPQDTVEEVSNTFEQQLLNVKKRKEIAYNVVCY